MFRAYDSQRERLVAVKLFKLDVPPERVHQLVAAFERLIAAGLTHPVLASPLATGMIEVSAFLVQDYVAAESLDLAVREYGAVPPADALRVAAQLGGALDFGAVVDIFHGALHPRDVLLSTDETRLTGLGVARSLEEVGVVAPVRRPYTAPERVAGGRWDRRADVFSLAALIHELLWGRRVAGTGRQAAEGLTEIPGGDLETLRVVFTRALAEESADRFETGIEFAEALKHAFPNVAIAGPSPTLNPGTPKRKARVQSAALVAQAEPIEPRLPLSDPDPMPAPVPAPEPIPAPRVEPSSDPEPAPAPADDLARPFAVDAALAFEPVASPPPPVASSLESRVGPEEVQLEPQPAAPASPHVERRPEASLSMLDRSRSAVWPLALALIVGIALGFAAGYGFGLHDRVATTGATAESGRESTAGVSPGELNPDTSGQVAAGMAPPAAAPTVAKAPVPSLKPPSPVETAPGRVLVKSVPSGARVVVDGRDRGTTPAAIEDLTRGSHRVLVMRDGYGTEARRVVITRGRPSQSLNVKLTRARVPAAAAGALIVESRPPGARVFLDGKLLGVTPLSIASVGVGDHAIDLDRDGYRRWSSSVRIVAAGPTRVTASLEK